MANLSTKLPDIDKSLPASIDAPQQPDQLALEQELNLKPTQQTRNLQRQLVTQLTSQVDDLKKEKCELREELGKLHEVRVQNAKYETADRMLKIVVTVGAVAVVIGGLMTAAESEVKRQTGYAVAILGLAIETLMALFNPRI